MVFISVLDVCQPAVIPVPGAKISTHEPQLEKDDFASVLVVAPTVIAVGVDDGE
jgi:hypothetical protein